MREVKDWYWSNEASLSNPTYAGESLSCAWHEEVPKSRAESQGWSIRGCQWVDAPGTFLEIDNWNTQATPTTESGLLELCTFQETVYYLGSTSLYLLYKSSHWRSIGKKLKTSPPWCSTYKRPLPKVSCFYVITQKFHRVQRRHCNTIQVHKYWWINSVFLCRAEECQSAVWGHKAHRVPSSVAALQQRMNSSR